MFVQETAYENHYYHYLVIFQGILLFSLIKYTRIKYEDYVYPLWGEALGWIITAVSMLLVPVLIVKTVVDIYCRGKGGAAPSEVRESFESDLRTVPTIVTAHTFSASRDTRVSYGWCSLIQEYFCAQVLLVFQTKIGGNHAFFRDN